MLSTTYSAPALAQGMALGSLSLKTVIHLPLTDNLPHLVLVTLTSPLWYPKWVESCLVNNHDDKTLDFLKTYLNM